MEQGRGSKSQPAAKKDGGRQRRKGLAQSKERGPDKGGRGKAWIKEGTEDEPVNFMDPVVVKSVLGVCGGGGDAPASFMDPVVVKRVCVCVCVWGGGGGGGVHEEDEPVNFMVVKKVGEGCYW